MSGSEKNEQSVDQNDQKAENILNFTTIDPWLEPYRDRLLARSKFIDFHRQQILGDRQLTDFALGYLYYGLHKTRDGGWLFREWAPNATKIYLICEATNWKDQAIFRMTKLLGSDGDWELRLPANTLKHLDKYKLHIYWQGSDGERLPAYANYVVQDDTTTTFNAVVWDPEQPYQWQSKDKLVRPKKQLIYEAHVGMSGEKATVASWSDFEKNVIPRIAKLGYNTIQLMAIQEHPYYASFGYQVSNFFAESSRFGNPDQLKSLIDTAHKMGIRVIMDIVHSHSVKNEIEGLGRFDGTNTQYFEPQMHPAWDSRLFNYGKPAVVHFLLSNVRFWLDEYNFDGFRFDGVTSMIYNNHGINQSFTSYDDYFGDNINNFALTYLTMVNDLVHQVNPQAITIAEDVSGMVGLAAPTSQGGIGFDYRFNMAVADLWIKMLKNQRDEDWNLGELFHQLTNHRPEELTINYAESHDQSLVGDKTIAFRLMDSEMYSKMSRDSQSLIIDRGIALHKMIRLVTASTNSGGYLNFMGNEFGHPEWIDFPRLGNDWSYKYARRQWSLVDNNNLRYGQLNNFDHAMICLVDKLNNGSEYSYVRTDNQQGVLSFVRDGKIFAFNFSANSYTGCQVPAPLKDYKIILSTDDKNYGGFARIDTMMTYSAKQGATITYVELYLPARTAVVLEPRYFNLTKSPWSSNRSVSSN